MKVLESHSIDINDFGGQSDDNANNDLQSRIKESNPKAFFPTKKRGAESIMVGPEPGCGIVSSNSKALVKDWLVKHPLLTHPNNLPTHHHYPIDSQQVTLLWSPPDVSATTDPARLRPWTPTLSFCCPLPDSPPLSLSHTTTHQLLPVHWVTPPT
ncbi:hypothetical protein J6590_029218 [Homalodisca vitripennis]|nr:hypothetical protein J6590_029218 [Homalodisca vitripennis]